MLAIFRSAARCVLFRQKLAGLPFLFSPRVMFINTAMLQAAGCAIPSEEWQWEDFIALVRRLRRRHPGSEIFAWNTSYYLWMNFVLRAGGAPDRSDGAESGADRFGKNPSRA
ncbi:MAG: extracellular solute-binding protein [Lentisphaeria bacterium]|nr:MAG: extracellular solute-binding protein [Lentisphaeria bacterium]